MLAGGMMVTDGILLALLATLAWPEPCPIVKPEQIGVIGPREDDAQLSVDAHYMFPDGGFVLATMYAGAVDFDATDEEVILHPVYYDALILRLDEDWHYVWEHTMLGDDGPWAHAITTGIDGQVLIVGGCWGEADFDPFGNGDLFAPVGDGDSFLTRLMNDGTYVETSIVARSLPGANRSSAYYATCGMDGAIYIAGEFSGIIDFGPNGNPDLRSSALGSWDCYLMKLAADGEPIWTRTFGGSSFDVSAGVVVAPDGSVYLTGTFRGSADFDPGPGVDMHYQVGMIEDSFLSKFDSDGHHLWTRTWPIRFSTGGVPVLDPEGNVLLAHWFFGIMDFNPGGLGGLHATRDDGPDVIVLKISPDGDYVWSFSTSDGKDWEEGHAIAVGENGDVFVTGDYSQTTDFDPGPGETVLVGDEGDNGFLLHLTSEGEFVTAFRIGDEVGWSGPKYVDVNNRGNPVVVSRFENDDGFATDLDGSCEAQYAPEREYAFTPPDILLIEYGCVTPTPDFDGDGVVGLESLGRFEWCLTGPGVRGLGGEVAQVICHPGCTILDLDADGDVDMADFAGFEREFAGEP